MMALISLWIAGLLIKNVCPLLIVIFHKMGPFSFFKRKNGPLPLIVTSDCYFHF